MRMNKKGIFIIVSLLIIICGINCFFYKKSLEKMSDKEEAEKLKEYLSENFPLTQQLKIILQYIWQGIIVIVPVILFIICFWVKM